MSATPGLRDEAYLDWVRHLPCVVHNPEAALDPWRNLRAERTSDPDHLPVPGLKGVGIKSPDAFVVPLCRECHEMRPRFFHRPWNILTAAEAERRNLPLRFVGWNPFETVARLLWAYHARIPSPALEAAL